MKIKRDALDNQHCETCSHWHNPEGRPIGMCVIRPPVSNVIGMTQSNAGPLVDPNRPPEMVPVLRSYYPQVAGQDGCHEHDMRKEAMN